MAVALAAPQQYARQQYSDAPAQYSYDYKVQDASSGVDFGQTESRDGAATQGSYYVALPDGRVQRVTYAGRPLHSRSTNGKDEPAGLSPVERDRRLWPGRVAPMSCPVPCRSLICPVQ